MIKKIFVISFQILLNHQLQSLHDCPMNIQETRQLTSDQLLSMLVLCGTHISNVISIMWNRYKGKMPSFTRECTKDKRM